MKLKLTCILLTFLLFSGLAFADDYSNDGRLVEAGDTDLKLGIGWGISAGAEYSLKDFEVAEFPLSVGIGVRAGMLWGFYTGGVVDLCGIIHWTPGAVYDAVNVPIPSGMEWIDNIDFYTGLGLGFGLYSDTVYPYFAWIDGISYQFSESLAVYVEGSSAASTIGIIFKL